MPVPITKARNHMVLLEKPPSIINIYGSQYRESIAKVLKNIAPFACFEIPFSSK
jgi:hypothetical protein